MDEGIDPGKYILIAEDNPADVYLVREVFDDQDFQYSLRVVSDGEQAVNFIDSLDNNCVSACPKLLVLDLHLPKRDGQEVLQYWRQSGRCGHIPVIIFTASVNPSELEAVTHHPATFYFRKPATLDQFMKLADLVRQIVGE